MAKYDNLINSTFGALGLPTVQPGMNGRGLPTDRLVPGLPGLPNPSPGSGLTADQLKALGGLTVDNQTGELAYASPSPVNPAVDATAGLVDGGNLPMRRSDQSTMPLPGMVPGATPIPRAQQQPGWQLGDGLVSLMTGGQHQGVNGLLEMLFGGGQQTPTRSPGTSIPVLDGDSAVAATAKRAGQGGYVGSGGMLMPTTSMGGLSRRTYGDDTGGPSTASNPSHLSSEQRRARLLASGQTFGRGY